MDDTGPVELHYREHFAWFYWALLVFVLGLAYTLTVVGVMQLVRDSDEAIGHGIYLLIVGWAPAAVISVALQLLLRPRALATIRLFPDRMILDGREVRFDQLVEARARVVPYFGAWLTLRLRDGRVERVGTLVRESGRIAEALLAALPGSRPGLERYLRAARLSDLGWNRSADSFRRWRGLAARQLLFPVVFGVLVPDAIKEARDPGVFLSIWYHPWNFLVQPILIATTIAAAVALAIWVPRELGLAWLERRQRGLEPRREDRAERWAVLTSHGLYLTVTLAIYAYFFAKFFLGL